MTTRHTMTTSRPPAARLLPLLLVALFTASGAARAGVVTIDIGGANIYSLGNFTSANNNVQGAIVAAGDITASGYAINGSNTDAYGGYAVVAGGALTYSSATLSNGTYYAGGGTHIANTVSLVSASASATLPLSFGATSAALTTLSASLSRVATSGSAVTQWGGLYLTGSGSASGVTVIDVTAAELAGVGYLNTAGLAAGSTLILNVGGLTASTSMLSGFSAYNVIYNFYEATSVSISNVALYGTVLAPLATITGSGASVYGQVVAGNWNASVTLNASHFFVATDVAGYSAAVVSAVPEPSGWQLLLAGLALLLAIQRKAGAPFQALRSRPNNSLSHTSPLTIQRSGR